MGTENSAADEWIELYNSGSEEVNLSGWILQSLDEGLIINFDQDSVNLPPALSPGGFFLLERTDDTSVPSISADIIYTGSLSNTGEVLILKNAEGVEEDRVDGSDKWKIGGALSIVGDNDTKDTAQLSTEWVTAIATPRDVNSSQSSEPKSEEGDDYITDSQNQEAQDQEVQNPPIVGRVDPEFFCL